MNDRVKCVPDAVFENAPRQYVYVMRSDSGLVKVGISNNTEKRRQSLSAAVGCKVEIVEIFGPFYGARRLERSVHEALTATRSYGEWFACSELQAVDAVRTALLQFVEPMTKALPDVELLGRSVFECIRKSSQNPPVNGSRKPSYNTLVHAGIEAIQLIEFYFEKLEQALEANEVLRDRVQELESQQAQLELTFAESAAYNPIKEAS